MTTTIDRDGERDLLSPREPLPDVRKIAVLRANGIGDYVFALPALAALRAAYPAAEIVYLGKPWHADFLANRPGPVDRVVVVPPSRGVNGDELTPENPVELAAFFAAMRRERFDLAVQLHGGGRNSNPFVRQLGARITAGLRTPDAPPLDRWVPYVYFQREVLRYLEVVGLVGAAPVRLEPYLAATEADLCEAARVLPPSGRPLAALNAGASDPQRRWPSEKFAAVGDALATAGAQVAVLGAPYDRPLVDAIISRMAHEPADLGGRLSLGGLVGLLARCRVVISNDSGPLHLAAAVGAATVGIYWCFNLVNAGPLTRTRHRPHISWQLACPVCGAVRPQQECQHTASFVADVPTHAVIASALDLSVRASHIAPERLAPGWR